MGKRELIIAPRLTLPMRSSGMDTVEMEVSVEEKTPPQPTHPKKKRKASRRNVRQTLSIIIRELVYLLVAGDLGVMAYWYLAPWPVYRIVSFVVIFILWSNFASETARVKTKQAIDMLSTVSVQAVRNVPHPRKQAMIKAEDTTGYLQAIKKSTYESIQTRDVYAVIPDHRRNRDFLDPAEAASD